MEKEIPLSVANLLVLIRSLELKLNINNVFFLRAGINNFQKALADGDTLNQKKVWIYQPSAGAGFKISECND